MCISQCFEKGKEGELHTNTSHPKVRNTPEDEPEERIEQGRHQTEQITEERNDFSDDEGEYPSDREDTSPAGPSDDGVGAEDELVEDSKLALKNIPHVLRSGENVEKHKSSGDGSVENTQKDQSWDHEAERDNLVSVVAKRAESRGCVVVCAGVGVCDTTTKREDEDFSNGHSPESLGEVPGLLHLGDERGQSNLANEGVADVEESVQTIHEGGALGRDEKELHLSRVGVACGVRLNGSEDGCEQHASEREQC